MLLKRIYSRLPVRVQRKLDSSSAVSTALYFAGLSRGRARRYLKGRTSRAEFIAELNRRGVSYVLLRWWETFPEFPANEDMDILIEDADLPRISNLLTRRPGGVPLDIYSVEGSEGHTWRGIPYLQRSLSRAILATRHLHNGVYVPCGKERFAALAYHAVYHKGRYSGLLGFEPCHQHVEHDYQSLLEEVARRERVVVEVSLAAIVNWLQEHEYAPGRDLLAKLVDLHPELEVLLRRPELSVPLGELGVLIVREAAEGDGFVADLIKRMTIHHELDILLSLHLDDTARERCRENLRGGKWDRGPYPKSGGAPARILAVFDYHPKMVPKWKRGKYRHVTNYHFIELKAWFRRQIAGTRLFTTIYNGLHSADNEMEAFEYLKIAAPERVARIKHEVERRRRRYETRDSVVEMISEGRRAKVELIERDGTLRVKKTFRVGCERFYERELYAARTLSQELEFIPPCLDHGDGYLVVPYYRNVLNSCGWMRRRHILARNKVKIARVVHEFFRRGLTHIDFSPDNVIITEDDEFYVVDFEFLQEYDRRPSTVDQAYEVEGFPAGFCGDVPIGRDSATSSFHYAWGWYIGSWRNLRVLR